MQQTCISPEFLILSLLAGIEAHSGLHRHAMLAQAFTLHPLRQQFPGIRARFAHLLSASIFIIYIPYSTGLDLACKGMNSCRLPFYPSNGKEAEKLCAGFPP